MEKLHGSVSPHQPRSSDVAGANERASWTSAELAHLGLRAVLGVNIATHGLVRVGHPHAFALAMLPSFEKTFLPSWAVSPFLHLLPFAELAIGVLILAGIRLKHVLLAGMMLIAALTFGSALQQAWEVVGLQLVYALAYFLLLTRVGDARWTVGGGLMSSGRTDGPECSVERCDLLRRR